jgi:hypothetical protein
MAWRRWAEVHQNIPGRVMEEHIPLHPLRGVLAVRAFWEPLPLLSWPSREGFCAVAGAAMKIRMPSNPAARPV